MTMIDEEGNEVVWNDLPQILDEWKYYSLTGCVKEPDSNEDHIPSCFVINSKQIIDDKTRRIDAWYWDPNKNNLAKEIEESVGGDITEIVRLGDLVVKDGIIVGIILKSLFGEDKVCLPGQKMTTYWSSDDDGVGSTDRDDTCCLICV